MPPLRYLARLSTGKTVLWCYLIWYLITVCNYFDPTPRIWLNSLGVSAIIGTGLVLSVNQRGFRDVDFWPTFRLFLMPFCVSSFSALIKGHGFFIVIPPQHAQQLSCIGSCAVFILLVAAIKRWASPQPGETDAAQPVSGT